MRHVDVKQLAGDAFLTKFEKANIIGTFAKYIEQHNVDTPSVTQSIEDPLLIATSAFYSRDINFSLRRYYFIAGKRYYEDFHVTDLREIGEEVRTLDIVESSFLKDIYDQPAVLHYLTPDEINVVLCMVLDQVPLPGMTNLDITGNKALYIVGIRGTSAHIQCQNKNDLRVYLTEELRRTQFANHRVSLLMIANYIGFQWNRSRVSTQQMVGYQLADAVVETQGVISAFHNIGKIVSALKALEATAALVKGTGKEHCDNIAFAGGDMNTFKAMQFNRKYSDLRFGDLLVSTAATQTSTIIDSALHQFFINHAEVADIGEWFLRLHFNKQKMCWHQVLLETIARKIRKALDSANYLIIPHIQASGVIDILSVNPPMSSALIVKSLEYNVIGKTMNGRSVNEGIRGIISYTPETFCATRFVMKEICLGASNSGNAYLWQIDRPEMELILEHNPFPYLLQQIDPMATFEYIETGCVDQPYSRQARIVIHDVALHRLADRIADMRSKNRDKYVKISHMTAPKDDEEALVRITSKQVAFELKPLDIINALGGEYNMTNQLAMQEAYRNAIDNSSTDTQERLQRLRVMNAGTIYDQLAIGSDFLSHFQHTFLLTRGTNFLENLRILPNADYTRSFPTNPSDMYRYFGLEAMRLLLLRSFIRNFAQNGKKADVCHLELIADIMTHRGSLIKLDDIENGDVEGSTLRLAIRGRATSVLRAASMKQTSDSIPGVVLSHLVGARVAAGTAGAGIVIHD